MIGAVDIGGTKKVVVGAPQVWHPCFGQNARTL
jgi:hypothetical protein